MSDLLYNEVIFKEHPILDTSNKLSENDLEYGITGKNFPSLPDSKIDNMFINLETGEFSQRLYCCELLRVVYNFSKSQINDFFKYQIQRVKNQLKWLYTFEKLIEIINEDSSFLAYYGSLKPIMLTTENFIKEFIEDPQKLGLGATEWQQLKIEEKSKPQVKIKKPDIDNQKATARKFLYFFSGINHLQNKIMEDEDYNRLLQYTDYLIEKEKVPAGIKKISQINLSTGMIRYTFYLIHKELYTTNKIKTEWIDFLHAVFRQFKNAEWITTKTKFSVKPPSYQHDKNAMNR